MSGIVNDSMDEDSIMDSEDRLEKIVDIYISAEAVRDMKHKKDTEDFNTTKTQTPEHTGSDGVKIRSFRAAAVCLVLLCVLLLITVIVLCVIFTQERQQFISKNDNLTRERDQLKQEKNDIKRSLGKVDGWKYYQSSLYFFSSEKKNWNESRRYCTERGADLIIINNTEEQDFVKNIAGDVKVWIGLTDTDVEGTWKWVDGSNMTSRFWENGQPDTHLRKEEDCALTHSPGWADYPCDRMFKWICEKSIFK